MYSPDESRHFKDRIQSWGAMTTIDPRKHNSRVANNSTRITEVGHSKRPQRSCRSSVGVTRARFCTACQDLNEYGNLKSRVAANTTFLCSRNSWCPFADPKKEIRRLSFDCGVCLSVVSALALDSPSRDLRVWSILIQSNRIQVHTSSVRKPLVVMARWRSWR
jgi:hypothetical protein